MNNFFHARAEPQGRREGFNTPLASLRPARKHDSFIYNDLERLQSLEITYQQFLGKNIVENIWNMFMVKHYKLLCVLPILFTLSGCLSRQDATNPAQSLPELRLISVSGGIDGKGRPVAYDGLTLYDDSAAYYLGDRLLEVKPLTKTRGTSIRTGQPVTLIQIEGELPCELVETATGVILSENVYDGYQYEFRR